MQADFDRNRIAGTLKYGLLDESKHLLAAAIIGIAVLLAGAVIGITFLSIDMSDGIIEVGAAIGGILGISIAFVVLTFCLLRYVLKNIWYKKDIELWLEDAVELKAYARKVSESDKYIIDEPKKYMIRVGFKYNGNHCKFTSFTDSCWRDYCDKEIDILYSPKHREVILLKPER